LQELTPPIPFTNTKCALLLCAWIYKTTIQTINPSSNTWFADVILPLSLPGLLTYEVPEDLEDKVKPGIRVRVQIGKRKTYSALVHHIHQEKPPGYKVRPFLSIADSDPVVNEWQLKLWDWMADYYMCSPGDVYRAAMPAGYKAEFLSYKPKTLCYVRLTEAWKEEHNLHQILDRLAKAPVQQKVVMHYLDLSGFPEKHRPEWIEKSLLLRASGTGDPALKSLVRKGILETELREVSRLDGYHDALQEPVTLNDNQREAFDAIRLHFEKKDVVLLHGITSSGKTEIYIRLILEELRKGRQVLYLLPEIALTTQIIMRLRKVFGERVGVYHSKYSGNERIEIWRNLSGQTSGRRPPFQIILGARSSLFLPFRNLGLVIVDEEHENTFKQYDPAPRYHARDTVIMLAQLHGAKVLLGSATPSLESYYNCLSGKYGLVELETRYLDLQPPEIKVVDIREAYRKKRMRSHFSLPLLDAIENSLAQKEQVMLFQNRRGFSLFIECTECGWVPHCARCDVSLTYHKKERKMVCHYCGYAVSVPVACEGCGSHNLQMKGFGTEKIEDEIALFFPDAQIDRMDVDAMRTRHAYEKVITAFARGATDILVGTQMITKGLDFDNVGLVGILNADNMLNYPDFRAYERAFQLMMQVSGRAGRRKKQGTVIIQAWDSRMELFHHLIRNDFRAFAMDQLADRKSFHYPPYTRIIEIKLSGSDKSNLDRGAGTLAGMLNDLPGLRVVGPEYPLISRIRSLYVKKIILKIDRDKSVTRVKGEIRKFLGELQTKGTFRSVSVTVDVDPM
jgi:primosomal protein N' (replication factor Y)